MSRSEAARAMGRAKTQRKAQVSRETLQEARKSRWNAPGAREKQAAALRAYWQRVKAGEAQRPKRKGEGGE